MATYSELLKHPKWQKRRLEIMQRDNFICQLCGDGDATLHVHHLQYNYEKMPWDVSNDCLVTYCELCHIVAEKTKLQTKYILKGVLKKKYLSHPDILFHSLIDIESGEKIVYGHQMINGVLEGILTLSIADIEKLLTDLNSNNHGII